MWPPLQRCVGWDGVCVALRKTALMMNSCFCKGGDIRERETPGQQTGEDRDRGKDVYSWWPLSSFYSLWADSDFFIHIYIYLYNLCIYINSIIFISFSLFLIRRGELFTETGHQTSKIQHRHRYKMHTLIRFTELENWQYNSFFKWQDRFYPHSSLLLHCCSLHCCRMSTTAATQANERSVSEASRDTVCTTGLLIGMSLVSRFWLVRGPFYYSD